MKQFILREPEHAKAMVAYVKANAGPQAAAKKPLVVTVAEYKAKRSTEANSRYWCLLEEIAEQAEIDGKRFSRETWHEHLKSTFAPKEDGPAGLVSMSTTQMNTEQFGRYVTQIEAFATQTLGVEFAAI